MDSYHHNLRSLFWGRDWLIKRSWSPDGDPRVRGAPSAMVSRTRTDPAICVGLTFKEGFWSGDFASEKELYHGCVLLCDTEEPDLTSYIRLLCSDASLRKWFLPAVSPFSPRAGRRLHCVVRSAVLSRFSSFPARVWLRAKQEARTRLFPLSFRRFPPHTGSLYCVVCAVGLGVLSLAVYTAALWRMGLTCSLEKTNAGKLLSGFPLSSKSEPMRQLSGSTIRGFCLNLPHTWTNVSWLLDFAHLGVFWPLRLEIRASIATATPLSGLFLHHKKVEGFSHRLSGRTYSTVWSEESSELQRNAHFRIGEVFRQKSLCRPFANSLRPTIGLWGMQTTRLAEGLLPCFRESTPCPGQFTALLDQVCYLEYPK